MAIISIIELSKTAQKRVRHHWNQDAVALVKPRGQGRWQVHAIEAPRDPVPGRCDPATQAEIDRLAAQGWREVTEHLII